MEQRRGAGRPPIPENQRARTVGFSITPGARAIVRSVAESQRRKQAAALDWMIGMGEVTNRGVEAAKLFISERSGRPKDLVLTMSSAYVVNFEVRESAGTSIGMLWVEIAVPILAEIGARTEKQARDFIRAVPDFGERLKTGKRYTAIYLSPEGTMRISDRPPTDGPSGMWGARGVCSHCRMPDHELVAVDIARRCRTCGSPMHQGLVGSKHIHVCDVHNKHREPSI